MSVSYRTASFGAGFDTNAYVVFHDGTRDAVIVDPGKGSATWLLDQVRTFSLTVHAVLLTHGHMDHSWDAQPLADRLGVPVYVGTQDVVLLSSPEDGLPTSFPEELLAGYPRQVPRSIYRIPGVEVQAGDLRVSTHAAPGHTAGSVVFLIGAEAEFLLSGDSYFGTAAPRAIPPTGDAAALSVTLAKLEAAAVGARAVLPGHGQSFTVTG